MLLAAGRGHSWAGGTACSALAKDSNEPAGQLTLKLQILPLTADMVRGLAGEHSVSLRPRCFLQVGDDLL